MRLIDNQHGGVTLRHVRDVCQRRQIAIHAEDTLRDDDGAPRARRFERGLERLEILVRVNLRPRFGKANAVDQAGMVQLV